jgi:hypothetical protein
MIFDVLAGRQLTDQERRRHQQHREGDDAVQDLVADGIAKDVRGNEQHGAHQTTSRSPAWTHAGDEEVLERVAHGLTETSCPPSAVIRPAPRPATQSREDT